MQYLVWPWLHQATVPGGQAAPVSWLSHLLRRSSLPSQQGKMYVKIFRIHVYLKSPTLPSYPCLWSRDKQREPVSLWEQWDPHPDLPRLYLRMCREDKEVNVRRENTGCHPRASGKQQGALGESLNMIPEADTVRTLQLWGSHWEEESAGRMATLQASSKFTTSVMLMGTRQLLISAARTPSCPQTTWNNEAKWNLRTNLPLKEPQTLNPLGPDTLMSLWGHICFRLESVMTNFMDGGTQIVDQIWF